LWHIFSVSITATVENDTIKLPPGVHLPDGTEVKVFLPGGSVSPEEETTLYKQLEDFVGCIKDGPEDLAAEHDHYAHGKPRRGSR
jgi:hypothetical protein